jgi:hypothetical protein
MDLNGLIGSIGWEWIYSIGFVSEWIDELKDWMGLD